MFEEQEIICIKKEELLKWICRAFDEGYRLVQIGCTKGEMYQMDYTFDRAYKFLDLRVNISIDDAQLPSITGIYACAFTYENEIHDLFGIRINGINVNYNGNFYRIAVKSPFNTPVTPPGKE